MLKQLTFYGKQTQASHIRKDLFQPFAAITCPSPEFGMNVYQKLREYRHVRDYNWTFAPTPKEIKESVEKANKRQTTPRFDTRLPTMKERAMLLMDQKASAIADLAHVIKREAEIARDKDLLKKQKLKKEGDRKEWQWKQITNLAAKARAGELENFEGWIKRREGEIEAATDERSKARGKKGLMMLKIKRNELLRAKEALDFIEGKEVPLIQRLKWNQNLCAMVQSRTDRIVNPEKPPIAPKEEEEEEAPRLKERAPKIPIQTMYSRYEKGMIEHAVPPSLHPSNARIDPRLEPYIRESRGLEPSSVLIQWRNLDDALYAKKWPKLVVHEQIRKELLADGNRFSEVRVPHSAFPGNEEILKASAEEEAERERDEDMAGEKEAKTETDEKEEKNSFWARTRSAVMGPFTRT